MPVAKGVLSPCPICDDLVPQTPSEWEDVYWNRGGILIKLGICKKCYGILIDVSRREIKTSKAGHLIRIHRGKDKP